MNVITTKIGVSLNRNEKLKMNLEKKRKEEENK